MSSNVDMSPLAPKFNVEAAAALLGETEASASSEAGSWGGRIWKCLPYCARISGGAISAFGIFATSYLYGTKYHSFSATPLETTLSTLIMGASIQGLLNSILPSKPLTFLNHLNKDNAFKIWFALTELYFYYHHGDVEKKDIVLSVLTDFLGTQAVIKVFDMLQKKMAEIPLQSPQALNAENTDPLEQKTCSMLLEPSNPLHFALAQIPYKVIPGIILTACNYHNIGVFILCDGLGTMLGVAVNQKKFTEIRNETCRQIVKTVTIIAFVAMEASWGLLLSAFPKNLAGIGASGLAAGFPTYFYKRQFQIIPPDPNINETRHPKLDTINKISNLLFIGAVGLWTGVNYQEVSDWGERTALVSGTLLITAAMLGKYWLIKKFKWGENNRVFNSAMYYAEYPVALAIVYALNENQGGFGSQALIKTPARALLAGWLPFYMCIGFSCVRSHPTSFIGMEGFAYAFLPAEMQGRVT